MVNPLTYQVDALRTLMVVGGPAAFPLWLDFGVLTFAVVALVCRRPPLPAPCHVNTWAADCQASEREKNARS